MMIKKFCAAVLAAAILLGAVPMPDAALMNPVSAASAEITYGAFRYTAGSGDSATITAYTGTGSAVVIPGSVNGKIVRTIGDGAFAGCATVTKFTIPATVTAVGNSAFENCTALTAVTIPDSVTALGGGVFFGCTALKTAVLPAGVKSLNAFETDGEIDGFFEGCTALTDVTLPAGLTALGKSVFYKCTSLKTVVIPATVTEIGRFSFGRCTALSSLKLPAGITELTPYLFYQCTSLPSLTIPSGVTNVGANAFQGASKLKSLKFPSGLVSVGKNAFLDCTALTSITLPADLTDIGANAFAGSGWYNQLANGVVYAGTTACGYKGDAANAALVVLKNGTKAISPEAFAGLTGLAAAVLPDGLASVGTGAFSGCTTLSACRLPDSVTSVGAAAFSGCASLRQASLPAGLTAVAEDLFNGCASLEFVEIPDTVTEIGARAFYGCAALAAADIPAGVTALSPSVFERCISLSAVKLPDSLVEIGERAFAGCPALSRLTCGGALFFTGDYFYGFDADTYEPSDALLVCPAGSSAQAYAESYGTAYATTDGRHDIADTDIALSQTAVLYTGEAITPAVTAAGLTEGTDYTVTYAANTAAGTAAVIVRGIGAYYGEKILTFTITPATAAVRVTGLTAAYDQKAHSVTVSAPGGTPVFFSTDGGAVWSAGTPAFTAAGKKTVGWYAPLANYAASTGSVTVTITAKSITALTARLSASTYTYNGSAKQPAVTLKDGKTALVSGTDFSVTYTDNKAPGVATVTIKGKGNYTGTLAQEFLIKPAKPTAKVSAGTKKATVSWSKVTGATSYEVWRATSASGTYTKARTVSAAAQSAAVTGLTTGKTYWFKVRAVTKDGTDTLTGAYSSVVSVKAK
ncbi:MAG: fibronectin type III domain-containing protein [Oscillospiraceae bacterium]